MKILRLSLFIFLFVITRSAAYASGMNIQICSEIWPPYYVNENKQGHPEGIIVDVAKEVTSRLGHKLDFEVVPYERCLEGAIKGKYTAAMGVDQLDGTDLIYGKNEYIYWILSAFVHQDDKLTRYNSLEDFRGHTWAKVDIYAYPEKVEAFDGWKIMNFRDQTDTTSDDDRGFKIIERKRADVYLEDYFWAQNTLKNENYYVKALMPPVAVLPMFSGFNKSKKELAKSWDQEVGQMLADGSVDRIYKKWSGKTLNEYFSLFEFKPPLSE